MKTLHIADLFCGAGGTSTGAIEAAQRAGYAVKLTAVNHWPVAIATHTANHLDARHLCTSIDDVDPRKLFKRGELFCLWASPECTHHSRARGGKPMNDQSRATAYCVPRWAEALAPEVIFVENVPEFEEWGPLGSNGKPLPSRKGALFRSWVQMLEAIGYKVDWKILCAADHGAPTTRRRLFVQAVRGRRQIKWPERTHASIEELAGLQAQGDLFQRAALKPWVFARKIIDWQLKGRWLDEMPGKAQYGGLPLSPKTLKRIHVGLQKYGLKAFITGSVDPFIVELKGTNGRQVRESAKDIESPLSTVATSGAHHSLVDGFIVPIDNSGNGQIKVNSIHAPLTTVTSKQTHGFIDPYLVPTAHTGDARCNSIDEPLKTICGNRDGTAVIEPHLLGQQSGSALRPVTEPVPTIATAGAIGLVEPCLIQYNGTADAQSVDEPLGTVTTKDRFALLQPAVTINGQEYRIRLRWRMLQPHELAQGQTSQKTTSSPGQKTDQVKQIGNAVPPALAAALLSCHLIAPRKHLTTARAEGGAVKPKREGWRTTA